MVKIYVIILDSRTKMIIVLCISCWALVYNKLGPFFYCLFFPVVYGAMLKAEQLAVAMEGRGFRAYPERTYLRRLEFNYTDYVLMLLFFVVTCLLVYVHTFTV